MMSQLFPLLFCIAMATASGKEWEGTIVTTPMMIVERFGYLSGPQYFGWNRGPPDCHEADLRRCTCFEVLNLNTGCTRYEVQKSFREASKTYHPDKGGNSKDFVFLRSCRDHLSIQTNLYRYAANLKTLEDKHTNQKWFRKSEFRRHVRNLNQQWILQREATKDTSSSSSSSSSSRPTKRKKRRRESTSSKPAGGKTRYERAVLGQEDDGLPLVLAFLVISSAVLLKIC